KGVNVFTIDPPSLRKSDNRRAIVTPEIYTQRLPNYHCGLKRTVLGESGAPPGIGHAKLTLRRPLRTMPRRRGMAQSGSASALGAEGRGFKSLCPDHPSRSGPADAACRSLPTCP